MRTKIIFLMSDFFIRLNRKVLGYKLGRNQKRIEKSEITNQKSKLTFTAHDRKDSYS